MPGETQTDPVADAVASLALISSGPSLAAALDCLDLKALTGSQVVDVLKARYRQNNHDRAQFLAVVAEVMHRGQAETSAFEQYPGEFASDEVRAALVYTRRAADALCDLAEGVVRGLPTVYQAFAAGVIDQPRVRVFHSWTCGLADEHVAAIVDALLPRAAQLTTAQLMHEIKRYTIALDPTWARRRYERALRGRRVGGSRNEDGTANLAGYDLPLDRVAAACDRFDRLAKAAKQDGHPDPIDHIRADLFLGMTDGTYAGLTDEQILARLLAEADLTQSPTAEPAPAEPASAEPASADPAHAPAEPAPAEPASAEPASAEPASAEPASAEPASAEPASAEPASAEDSSASDSFEDDSSGGGPSGGGPSGGGPSGGGTSGGGPYGSNPSGDDPRSPHEPMPASPDGASETTAGGRPGTGDGATYEAETTSGDEAPARRGSLGRGAGGLRLLVGLATLTGADVRPGDLIGWGPVHAELACTIATTPGASWWFVLAGTDGAPLTIGQLRSRPGGPVKLGGGRYPGLQVWLQVNPEALAALRQSHPPGWDKVIAEITAKADSNSGPPNGDPTARLPGAALRRWIQVRDRTCQFPGCRVPAHRSDADHSVEHADGGPTIDTNLSAACRHDHRLRHDGGWSVSHNSPGHVTWTSRLGHTYRRRPVLDYADLPEPMPTSTSDEDEVDETSHPSTEDWHNSTCMQPERPQRPAPPPPPPPPPVSPNDDPPPF